MSIRGYDQWKTATPYDDDVDPIEDAVRWLEVFNGDDYQPDKMTIWAATIIEALLDDIK